MKSRWWLKGSSIRLKVMIAFARPPATRKPYHISLIAIAVGFAFGLLQRAEWICAPLPAKHWSTFHHIVAIDLATNRIVASYTSDHIATCRQQRCATSNLGRLQAFKSGSGAHAGRNRGCSKTRVNRRPNLAESSRSWRRRFELD